MLPFEGVVESCGFMEVVLQVKRSLWQRAIADDVWLNLVLLGLLRRLPESVGKAWRMDRREKVMMAAT